MEEEQQRHEQQQQQPLKQQLLSEKVSPSVAASLPPRAPDPDSILCDLNKDDSGRKPVAVKVPPRSIFHPERYLSPTDSLVSPISKGLLSRNRKPTRTLVPPVPPKALEGAFYHLYGENKVI